MKPLFMKPKYFLAKNFTKRALGLILLALTLSQGCGGSSSPDTGGGSGSGGGGSGGGGSSDGSDKGGTLSRQDQILVLCGNLQCDAKKEFCLQVTQIGNASEFPPGTPVSAQVKLISSQCPQLPVQNADSCTALVDHAKLILTHESCFSWTCARENEKFIIQCGR